jgi:hypothetical protein
VGKMPVLDVWPSLPIAIRSYLRVDDTIISALERHNRVRSISFGGERTELDRLVAVMEEPFPVMDLLFLRIDDSLETAPALPNTFLGGSAPRLRSFNLRNIPFPTLPRLLLSCNDLVELSLKQIPHSGYISPETMAICISAMASLDHLSIRFKSPASRPDPRNRHPPPLTRAILPALTKFDFRGTLEDLVARIDAPLLDSVEITFFNQLVFDIRQFPRFIAYAPELMSCDMAQINIYDDRVEMRFMPRENSLSPL